MRAALALSTPALLASCSALRHEPLERLAVLREVPVAYHAEFGPSTAQRSSSPGAPAEPAPVAAPAPPAVQPSIETRCALLRFDADAEAALFGPGRVEGRVVAQQDLAAARERCERAGLVETVGAPALCANDGQRAYVSMSSETAFVRAFTLSPASGSMIVDPEVATVREGYRLEALSRLADCAGAPATPGTIDLEFAIDAIQLVRPVGEVSAPIPGLPNAVTLQLPLGFEQHIGGRLALARGEVLVVRGLVDGHGRPFVACIESRLTVPQTAALAAR